MSRSYKRENMAAEAAAAKKRAAAKPRPPVYIRDLPDEARDALQEWAEKLPGSRSEASLVRELLERAVASYRSGVTEPGAMFVVAEKG